MVSCKRSARHQKCTGRFELPLEIEARAEMEQKRADLEQERAERLAEQLRALGVEPHI